MIAYIALFSALLSRLIALACGVQMKMVSRRRGWCPEEEDGVQMKMVFRRRGWCLRGWCLEDVESVQRMVSRRRGWCPEDEDGV